MGTMDNVIRPGFTTLQDIPVDTVLDGNKDLEYVLVLGYNKSGEFVAACSEADLAKATFAAQHFITQVHVGGYGGLVPLARP